MKLIIILINLLNTLLPKSKSKLVVISTPDFDDNTRAVFEDYNQKVICLTSSSGAVPYWVTEEHKYYRKNSLIGVFHLCTSRIVLFTHGVFNGFSLLDESRQIVINITHGMYIKKMGLQINKNIKTHSHYILSTSHLFKQPLSEMFGVDQERVIVKGLLRNRYLLRDKSAFKKQLFKEQKVICWMPTWRKSVDKKVSFLKGTYSGEDDLLGMNGVSLIELNNLLVSNNILMLIKPHPLAEYTTKVENLSNIKILLNEELNNFQLTLYELLSLSDALITDFSSVFVDYLLTKKPIGFSLFDIENYTSSRELAIDLEEIGIPGSVINSWDTLNKFVSSVSTNESSVTVGDCYTEVGVCPNIENVINDIISKKLC